MDRRLIRSTRCYTALCSALFCVLFAVGCTTGDQAGADDAGTGKGQGGSTTTSGGQGGSTTSGGQGGSTTSGGQGGSTTGGGQGGSTGGGQGGMTGGGTGGRTTTTGAGGAVTGAGGAVTGAGGAIVPPPQTNEFWISPTGSDTNPGTQAQPLFTLCDDTAKTGACYKLCPTSAGCLTGGATIWVMDGTYKYGAVTQKIGSTKLCTLANPCNVFAVAGAHPVFDFTGQPIASTSRGIQVQGDFWHLRGITVTKAGDSGIFVMGNNNTIEQCVSHHNQDMGFVVGVNSSRPGTGVNNTFLNCDSYQNFDTATDGENADGYGAKENSGAGNVFRGCRAWDNADDGWDFYGWTDPITVDNCWAVAQTATVHGGNSDGNGFKLGGNNVRAAHLLSNLFSVSNGANGSSGRGFTNNSNPATLTCTGTCASYGNKGADTGVGGITVKTGPTAAQMMNAARMANGNLPPVNSL